MLRDAENLSDGEDLEADVCIVGAGAAGITIARDLAGSDTSVLLLESGGRSREEKTQSLYEGESEGFGNVKPGATRVRAYGGTTRVWGGYCRPLQPIDFEDRDWYPMPGWPIERSDLEPFYQRAAETLRIGAHQWDAEAVAQQNDSNLMDFGDLPVTTGIYQYSAPPVQFQNAYGNELANADNIEVYLHANMTHIELGPDGEDVRQLECETLGGTSFTAEADRYVLAMGGMENPRMMLASNDIKSEGIGNEHDHVGRYFMDHPRSFDGGAFLLMPADTDVGAYLGRKNLEFRDEDRPDGRTGQMHYVWEIPEQTRREEGLLGLSMLPLEKWEPDEDKRDIIGGNAEPVADATGVGHGGDFRVMRIDLRTEQAPVGSSRIELMDETDALGIPRIRVKWDHSDLYFDGIYRSLRTLGRAMAQMGLGRIWISTDDEGTYDHWIEGAHHHMGTTRMSDDPEDGVVDADCKVHGVSNLYVAGCSVFASAGYGNPTYTIVALAHRLADYLDRV